MPNLQIQQTLRGAATAPRDHAQDHEKPLHSPAPPGPATAANLERAVSIVTGTLLLAPVLRSRSSWRWAAAAAGGALIYSGVSGTIGVTESLAASVTLASPVIIRQSITIGRDAVDLSSMWRKPDVIARVTQILGEVEVLGSDHFRWAVTPFGQHFQVECILAEERPGELVHWTSMPSGALHVDQRMRFKPAPQGRGTEVSLEVLFDLSRIPAGRALRGMSSFAEGPARIAIRKLLHNFKSLAETGEVPTLERNPSGRAGHHQNGDLL